MTEAADRLSIVRAAQECPQGIALRTPQRDWTFAEAANEAQEFLAGMKRPAAGRPYLLSAAPTEQTVFALYGFLEARIPTLLLHPLLTAFERAELLESIEAIDAPLAPDTAFVLFTSGTSGIPKPAMLPRGALLASAESSAVNIPLGAGDVWTMPLSPARVGGLSILTRCLIARATAALCPKFTSASFVSWLEESRATLTSLVPTMLAKVFAEAMPAWLPPARLRAVLLGGAEAPRAVMQEAMARRVPIVATYGMTETASNIATTPFADRLTPGRAGTLTPNAGVELRIAADEVIEVRAPMVMAGYWGREPLNRTDWFSTGDLGRWRPDGTLQILSRRSDLFQTGGENIYPAEIEAALSDIPGIAQARVGGIPDETWGHIVTALLVPEHEPLPEKDLVAAIVHRLSPYKCPRRICWVTQLPVTSAGKPDRRPECFLQHPLRTMHYSSVRISSTP